MAYSAQAVTSMSDIPAAVAAFAAAQGWTVNTTTPTQPIFTLPTTDSLINFKMFSIVSGVDHTVTLQASGSAVPTSTASTRSPKLAPASGTTASVPLPYKIHMFAPPAPNETPYLATVIEYGTNLFRHLYLGRMNRIGGYAGGEVISGQQGPISALATTMDFDEYAHTQYLFGSRSSVWADTACGGVNVSHADNANQWRKFRGYGTGMITSLPDDCVLGGFGDAANDGYLANGEINFYGVNPLIPINLYAVKPVTSDKNFVPIGSPAGVRLVNMKNLDPGAQINVGGRNWRVFPAMAKNESTTMPRDSSHGNWRSYESSYYVGYAYPES